MPYWVLLSASMQLNVEFTTLLAVKLKGGLLLEMNISDAGELSTMPTMGWLLYQKCRLGFALPSAFFPPELPL